MVLGFVENLSTADIVHEGTARLRACQKVAETVGDLETNLVRSVLVAARELAHRLESLRAANSYVPKFDSVVSRASDEDVECIWIVDSIGVLVKLDRMRCSLVITHRLAHDLHFLDVVHN